MATETSNTISHGDGTFTLQQYQTPINFRQADGAWAPIDTTLVDAPGATYAAQNAAGDYIVKIPQDPSAAPVYFAHDGAWVTMHMHGTDDTSPCIDGSTASVEDVAHTDGVTYTAVSTGVKEDITLDTAPPAPLSYIYDITTSEGLTPSVEANGEVAFTAADGTVPVSIPAAEMHDSATPIAESNAISYTVTREARGWKLTVTPDYGWLTDPARVYPAVVDPSLSDQAPTTDCYIQSASPDTNHCGDDAIYIRVGGTDSTHRERGLLRFNVSQLVNQLPVGSTIDTATVQVYMLANQASSTASTDYSMYQAGLPFTNAATWNSAGPAGAWVGGNPKWGTKSGTATLNGQGDAGFRGFDVTDTVEGWVDGTADPNGLVFQQGTAVNNQLLFYSSAPANASTVQPRLEIDYIEPKPIPAGVTDPSDVPNVPAYTPDPTPAGPQTISGFVTKEDGTGVAGLPVKILVPPDGDGIDTLLGTVTTGAGGFWTFTMPAVLPANIASQAAANDGVLNVVTWSEAEIPGPQIPLVATNEVPVDVAAGANPSESAIYASHIAPARAPLLAFRLPGQATTSPSDEENSRSAAEQFAASGGASPEFASDDPAVVDTGWQSATGSTAAYDPMVINGVNYGSADVVARTAGGTGDYGACDRGDDPTGIAVETITIATKTAYTVVGESHAYWDATASFSYNETLGTNFTTGVSVDFGAHIKANGEHTLGSSFGQTTGFAKKGPGWGRQWKVPIQYAHTRLQAFCWHTNYDQGGTPTGSTKIILTATDFYGARKYNVPQNGGSLGIYGADVTNLDGPSRWNSAPYKAKVARGSYLELTHGTSNTWKASAAVFGFSFSTSTNYSADRKQRVDAGKGKGNHDVFSYSGKFGSINVGTFYSF